MSYARTRKLTSKNRVDLVLISADVFTSVLLLLLLEDLQLNEVSLI